MLAAAVCFAKCEEAELVAGTWRYKAIRADFLRLLVERTVTVVARELGQTRREDRYGFRNPIRLFLACGFVSPWAVRPKNTARVFLATRILFGLPQEEIREESPIVSDEARAFECKQILLGFP